MSDEKSVLRIRELDLPVPVNASPKDEKTIQAIAKFRSGEKLTDDEVKLLAQSMAANGGGNGNCNAC